MAHDGCGTYECAPQRRVLSVGQKAEIQITDADLVTAHPLPKTASPSAAGFSPTPLSSHAAGGPSGQTNRLAVVALLVAVAGILLVGFVTGIVAMIMAAFALGQIQRSGQRGAVWGLLAMLLGLVDTVGWIVLLSLLFSRPDSTVALDDFPLEPPNLDNVQPSIARAMRANVLIKSSFPVTGQAIGSGVIVSQHDGETLIVTNRHVVDARFHDRGASDEIPKTELTVQALRQLPVAARVVWVAPDGIDVAVVSAPIHSENAEAAPWNDSPPPAMGDDVFSIGNPQGLGWSHTKGSVSQIRSRRYGSREIALIQTDTAINPGNSGGGLYDKDGNLVGINTWTNDKRMSEGLSFALSFASVVELAPPFVQDR